MLKPGDAIPLLDLPALVDGRSGRVTLAGISSELVVLFFYPRDFSFICPTEVTGFGKALSLFAAENTAVLGVSVDDVESHRRWAAELGGVTYPLLADQGGEFAKACGVFDEREQVAMRATFLLDKKGTVIFAEACPINVGRSVEETLRIVRAYRSGRLCPADWEPGEGFGPSDRKY
ncbi:MAG: redoxin domain-containing protein [Deltaproteobacteria bacterium]|nr:redoxin domain-containing protein [Deltaproteobacteria bacterium]